MKNVVRAAYAAASSVSAAVLLLLLIIAASMAGALVPQGRPLPEYLLAYGGTGCALLYSLGLTDVFHSSWFILLLILFSVNLAACSIRRLRRGAGPGFALTHLSLLCILAGALIGSVYGSRGYVFLKEGCGQDYYSTGRRAAKLGFTVYLEDFELQEGNGRDTGMNFRSRIQLREPGRPPVGAALEVNKPFSFNGYAFYQSWYDPAHLDRSGIEVVRDPGLPLVYAGILLLNLGILLSLAEKYRKGGPRVYS